MADSYQFVKGGKLKLKGQKDKKHKKHKRRKLDGEGPVNAEKQDLDQHGGWWSVQKFPDIVGNVAIEFGERRYIMGQDNGLFSLGPMRQAGDAPDAEEILTAIKLNDTKIALKSGYDKYLSVNEKGRVVGRSDAIATKEQWEPVFQDGKVALCSFNGNFISVDEDGDVLCTSTKVGPSEILQLRCTTLLVTEEDEIKKTPNEEKGWSLKEAEINYVKKFQSFVDRRLLINEDEITNLIDARKDGTLHEALLDRRTKMKADRYCK